MNPILQPRSSSDGPWQTGGRPAPPPDTSTLPAREAPSPATAPRRGASVSSTVDALRAKTARLGDMQGPWVDSLRNRVRGSPLVCVAAAVTLGAMIARYASAPR